MDQRWHLLTEEIAAEHMRLRNRELDERQAEREQLYVTKKQIVLFYDIFLLISGKQVSTKWNNIRDSWLKTVKKQKDESKSGSSAKMTRNYLYHEQLMLKKVSEPRPPHESVSKKARTETEVGTESDFRSPLKKEKRKIDNKEVNDRMVKFLDSRINPEKENHHLSFFKGIIPILNTLNIEETLEFQASVMTMLQKIKSRNYERPNWRTLA
ncbi:uncharacterized protein [Epargyreus clarus]|uniref:uncharacterized protein n=1 Tax=Epargyreus clarus TaxID=520877 RepID=UPI003C2D6EEB